jgi:hypothetical protein
MEDLLAAYPVPEEKEMLLYTYVRLAHGFSDYATRLKSVQARLQALSVLIYSNQLTDSIQVGGPLLTITIPVLVILSLGPNSSLSKRPLYLRRYVRRYLQNYIKYIFHL